MTQRTIRPPTHTGTSSGADRRSPHAPLRPGRRPSTRLISEAVVASYLHDISQRHRDDAHESSEHVPGEHGHRREYLV